MGAVGLNAFLVSTLVFIISMHTFYQNIHAQQNQITPSSSSVTSPATRILTVGVPWKTMFTEFVSVEKNGTNFTVGGFCVKVFEAAIETLNYSVRYIPVGDGIIEPNYDDDLIQKIVQEVYIYIYKTAVLSVSHSRINSKIHHSNIKRSFM